MTKALGTLCVFCGSSFGASPRYREGARQFGAAMARRGLDLVWGGGRVGLMGEVADAVLDGGRRAIGVIPSFLVDREIGHPRASELIITANMHERKAAMAARADAFVLLPGGLGSFEEFFEVLTWAYLGLHHRPIGIFNCAGYFDPLLGLLQHTAREGFAKLTTLEQLVIAGEPAALLDLLEARHAASGSQQPEALENA